MKSVNDLRIQNSLVIPTMKKEQNVFMLLSRGSSSLIWNKIERKNSIMHADGEGI